MSGNAKNVRTRHFGRLTSGEFMYSQKEREPMFVGTFEIISDAGKEPNAIKVLPATKVRWWGSLSEEPWKSGTPKVEGTIDGLRACGWQGASLATVPTQITAGGLAREVYLTVEHYQGKMKVAFVDESRGTGGNEDMPLDQLAELSARLEARIAGLKPKKERMAASKVPPPDEDDRPPPDDSYAMDRDFPL